MVKDVHWWALHNLMSFLTEHCFYYIVLLLNVWTFWVSKHSQIKCVMFCQTKCMKKILQFVINSYYSLKSTDKAE